MRKIPYRVTAGVLSAIMLAASMPITDAEVLAAQTNMESTADDTEAVTATEVTEEPESETESDATEVAEDEETETDEATEAAEDEDVIEDESETEEEAEALSEEMQNTEVEETETEDTQEYAEGTFGFGRNSSGETIKQLAPGTYSVPVALLNGGKVSQTSNYTMAYSEMVANYSSMAGSCINGPATLTVHEDGSATISIGLQAVSAFGQNGSASDWTIYTDTAKYMEMTKAQDTTLNRVTARVDATAVENYKKVPTRITFTIPSTDQNVVFTRMFIAIMGINQDAAFGIDWSSAVQTSTDTSATSDVDGSVRVLTSGCAIGTRIYNTFEEAAAKLTDGKTMVLGEDVTLSANVEIAGGTIDLNGHTINQAGQYTITTNGATVITDNTKTGTITWDSEENVNSNLAKQTIITNAELTVKNITVKGAIECAGEGNYNVALDGVTGFTTYYNFIRDDMANGAGVPGVNISIVNSSFKAVTSAGEETNAYTMVLMKGKKEQNVGNLSITNTTVNGRVEYANNATLAGDLTITGSTITSAINEAVEFIGNNITVTDSKISTTGNSRKHNYPAVDITGSGTATFDGKNEITAYNGTAVYNAHNAMQSRTSTGVTYGAKLIIKDGVYTGNYNPKKAEETIYSYGVQSEGTAAEITGGYFKGVTDNLAAGYIVPDGMRMTEVASGTYSGYSTPMAITAENPADYVVKIYNADGTEAGAFEEDNFAAVTDVMEDGQTAVLQKDVTFDSMMRSDSNATLDLNGHTLTYGSVNTPDSVSDTEIAPIAIETKKLTIIDSSADKSGKYVSAGYAGWSDKRDGMEIGELELRDITADLYVAYEGNGNLIVRGGTYNLSSSYAVNGFFHVPNLVDIGSSTWVGNQLALSSYVMANRYTIVQDGDTYTVTPNELGTAIEAAEELNESDYTKASWDAADITTKLAAAKALTVEDTNDDGSLNEKSLKTVEALNTAMQSLVKTAAAETKAALKTAIETAKAVDGSKYTEDSYKNLQTALTAAEEALNNRVADADATTALNALNAAMNSLVAKTEDTKPSDTQTPDNTAADDTTQSKEVTTPGSVKATVAYNQIKLSWKASDNATGYEVYQKNGKTFKKIATVKKTSYTVKKLTTGTKYTFKVRAYGTVDGKKTYSGYTKVVSAKPAPAAPQKVAVKNSAKKTAKLSWKKVAGADGYEVYRSNAAKGKFKKIATSKSGKSVSYTNKKLSKNKTYYYKVRAYKNVKGKKVYGEYSKVVKIKIKK